MIRKPLVIVNGQIQQLQAGDDVLATAAQYDGHVATNGESATALVVGTPVYASAASTVKEAKADALSTSAVVGVMVDASTAAGAIGTYASAGVVTATTAQWDAAAGTTGGLTFNTLYFLDAANPGKLTSVAPTLPGQVVVPVAKGLSATEAELALSTIILL